MADESSLAFLGELERAESEVAEALAELEALAAEVDGLRARALDLDAFFGRLPAERERLAGRRDEAVERVRTTRAAVAKAEQKLSAAEAKGSDEERGEARNAVVRLRDSLHVAERGAGEAREELEALERHAEEASREAEELAPRAGRVAEELRARPRLGDVARAVPGRELASLAAWASTARAALFVARGSLAADQDALIRQANELAASLLGENVVGGSIAAVARRVRSASGSP